MLIDETMAMEALARVVENREDYVYRQKEGCYYERDNAPSCGVGCALADLGMSVSQLRIMDGTGSGRIGYVILPAGWTMTSNARKIFAAFQRYQDGGIAWGKSLSYAKEVAAPPDDCDNYGQRRL